MEHTENGHEGPQSRGRGGLESAIRGALNRTGPAGPAHWGRPRPQRGEPAAPVDVVGRAPLRRLPPTD